MVDKILKNPHQMEYAAETETETQASQSDSKKQTNLTTEASAQVQQQYHNFVQEFQSLVMGTTNVDGKPNASYAPFTRDDAGNFYVFLSGLAKHTENLHRNARASVLFVEDEKQAQQIFARKRLTLDCIATFLQRETKPFEAAAALFATRFQQMFATLREMMDFQMVQLAPQGGRFVIGFGQAYEVPKQNNAPLLHIAGKDHTEQTQQTQQTQGYEPRNS